MDDAISSGDDDGPSEITRRDILTPTITSVVDALGGFEGTPPIYRLCDSDGGHGDVSGCRVTHQCFIGNVSTSTVRMILRRLWRWRSPIQTFKKVAPL